MYRITADGEATFEEKTRRLIDLGRRHLELPYGFLTRIEETKSLGDEEDDAPPESVGASSGQAKATQKILYASGDHPLLQSGETCPLSEAYCRRTIGQEELLSIQNAPADGWKADPARERFGFGAYIGSRIEVEGELYGTFCFASQEARARPFSNEDEALVELLTRWASYELERQRSRERTEQFAELVTHDLRNPLNAAQMNLYMARHLFDSEDLDSNEPSEALDDEHGEEKTKVEKLQKHLRISKRALDRMEGIITDTLALAHGDQNLGPDDVTAVRFRDAAEASWEQAGSPDATLCVENEARTEGSSKTCSGFLAHEGRLRQLLENLFRNAIDHAGRAATVTASRTEDGFFVADDGPGIPPEQRETVFEAGHSTREGGTGLGLVIVREVAEAHGWSLSVSESNSGGARFEIAGVEPAAL
ncbi:sensor histidine kinase [Salinibacter grassmerensis]|uniref:sensor histidine kinase n=1 Tax=Salinibacter grassmerensis TaxID=3040353 RepID=UPI0021E924FA|nr:GAF domain-containing sensor histidine kinase [Salinibacter grassmerensis]